MVTELASCVQFQGRVTIYFFPLPLFLRPQAEPTYVSRVFQFVRLKPKESIKERQNKEVKRTKTKSLEAQTSVTKKKKKAGLQILGSIEVSISACHAEDPGSIPGRGIFELPARSERIFSLQTSFHFDLMFCL